MFLVRGCRNCLGWANLGAPGAADAVIVHCIGNECFALARGADAGNVRFVFFAKIAQRGQNRIRRALAQTAKTASLYRR